MSSRGSAIASATAPRAKCAIWARVSTTDQHATNQLTDLRQRAADRGLDVAAEFITEDSAWSKANGNGKGAEFYARRNDLLEGARLGRPLPARLWAPSCRVRLGLHERSRDPPGLERDADNNPTNPSR